MAEIPNVAALAALAAAGGADLRVLVLDRDARGLLASTVTHRHFFSAKEAAARVASGAAALAAQLARVDDYACARAGALANASLWAALGLASRADAMAARLRKYDRAKDAGPAVSASRVADADVAVAAVRARCEGRFLAA